MRKIGLVIGIPLLLIFSGCASVSPTSGERTPSSSATVKSGFAGKVKFSEGKHTSGGESEVGEPAPFYTLQVDCDRDGRLSREEQGRIVRFEHRDVSLSQRTQFSEFKRLAEQRERKASASPYLIVRFEKLSGNPCASNANPIGRVLTGQNPTFSAR